MPSARAKAEKHLRTFQSKSGAFANMPKYVGINGQVHATGLAVGGWPIICVEPASFRRHPDSKEERQTRFRKAWIVAPHFWDDDDAGMNRNSWAHYDRHTSSPQKYAAPESDPHRSLARSMFDARDLKAALDRGQAMYRAFERNYGLVGTVSEVQHAVLFGSTRAEFESNRVVALDYEDWRKRVEQIALDLAAEKHMALAPLIERGWISQKKIIEMCGIDRDKLQIDMEGSFDEPKRIF